MGCRRSSSTPHLRCVGANWEQKSSLNPLDLREVLSPRFTNPQVSELRLIDLLVTSSPPPKRSPGVRLVYLGIPSKEPTQYDLRPDHWTIGPLDYSTALMTGMPLREGANTLRRCDGEHSGRGRWSTSDYRPLPRDSRTSFTSRGLLYRRCRRHHCFCSFRRPWSGPFCCNCRRSATPSRPEGIEQCTRHPELEATRRRDTHNVEARQNHEAAHHQ